MEAEEQPGKPRAGRELSVRAEVRQALEEAAQAVLADDAGWRHHAMGPTEAREALDGIVDYVSGRQEHPCNPANTGVATLAVQLSHMLRRELLADPRGLSSPALIDVMRRLEQCRLEMEPQDRQELAFLLTGANAMQLVVEFAHDLRSPLTSIMFLAETLRKGQSGEINDVQREQLGIIYSAALGMVGVANDLMDMARGEVEEAWSDSTEEAFSIRELVESTRDTVAPMAEQKRLDISFFTPQHDVRVGHPVLLNRILLNLMTNALKFTEQGRVEVVVQERPGERVQFLVRDTGRGMDGDVLQSIYTLFGRSESRTGYHFSGTGLGLSICRRLVERMGGTLDVESQRGQGSTFSFEIELPRA